MKKGLVKWDVMGEREDGVYLRKERVDCEKEGDDGVCLGNGERGLC